MKTKFGDLIQLAQNGEFDVIIHGCNCFCAMGAGIAKGIKAAFPEAYEADCKTPKGDKEKLGTIRWVTKTTNNKDLIIVNGYTQYHYAGKGRKLDYEALRKIFKIIKQNFSGLRIGYPAIGAGLAGGNWETIATIIEEELIGENHTFVAFEP